MSNPYAGPKFVELEADAARALEFLEWKFEFATKGLLEIGFIIPSTGKWGFSRFGLNRKKDAAEFAAEMNRDAGRSMYYRAATVQDIGKEWTTDKTVEQLLGPCADLDDPGVYERSLSIATICRPNGMVVTGTVPHTRVQYLWRASEPTAPGGAQRGMNERLVGIYNSDPLVVNDSTFLRLPWMVAYPYKPGREPELVKFFLPPDDRPKYYPWHMLGMAFPAPERAPQAQAPAAAPLGAPAAGQPSAGLGLGIEGLIRNLRPGNRHVTRLALVNHYIGRGWSDAEILRAISVLDWGDTPPNVSYRKTVDMIASGRAEFGKPDPAVVGEATVPQQPPLDIVTLGAVDGTKIPPRPWLAPGVLIRGHVTLLAAPPGSGKSLYSLQIALAMAAHTPFGSVIPRQQAAVLLLNAEDDYAEQTRRVYACREAMGLAKSPAVLHIARDPASIRVVEIDQRTGNVLILPLYRQIVDRVKELKIDVLTVDPFVETMSGNENSNQDVYKAAALWRGVARECNCSVLLIHHTRKGGQAADADAVRGAGSLIGLVRVALTMFGMTEDEATRMNIEPEDRTKYVRLDDVKANMHLISGRADWFEKTTIEIPNAQGMTPGDQVGALKPWIPPGAFDGISPSQAAAIVATLDAGMPNGERYGLSLRGGSTRWGGQVVIDATGKSVEDAKRILAVWIKTKVIEERDYMNSDHKTRKGLYAVAVNTPGAVI